MTVNDIGGGIAGTKTYQTGTQYTFNSPVTLEEVATATGKPVANVEYLDEEAKSVFVAH